MWPRMDASQLRCLIAAGGTAGHVLPALAVADALRERGVHVTFAGSPERAEAQLVPAAGYELDTFRVSGLPRRPGVALVRALGRAVAAPFACRSILEQRRPDIVLGGGGYVAGPMVLAAWTKRIPGSRIGSRRRSRGACCSRTTSPAGPAGSTPSWDVPSPPCRRRGRASAPGRPWGCRRTGRCCSSRGHARARRRSTTG